MANGYAPVWPDVATHPGEHIQDFYDEDQTIPVRAIASESGLQTSIIQGLINGEVSVTPAIASGLSKALGTRSTYWENLQADYERTKGRIEENKRFNMVPFEDFTVQSSGVSPIQELTDNGDVPWRYNKVEQARLLCEWLGVPNLDDYQERLLGHFQPSGAASIPNPAPTVAWLRRGELAAIEESHRLPPFSEGRFADSVRRLNGGTNGTESQIENSMRKVCNEAGVAFVMPVHVPGCQLRSATRWLDHGRPMIQLALRSDGDSTASVLAAFSQAATRIINRAPDYLELGEPSTNGRRPVVADPEHGAKAFASQS